MSLLLYLKPNLTAVASIGRDKSDIFTSVATYRKRKKKRLVTREQLLQAMYGQSDRPAVYISPSTFAEDPYVDEEILFLLEFLG